MDSFISFYDNINKLVCAIHARGSISYQVQQSGAFFIKLYFRILNDNQSISCIISLTLVIALQLHKQLECISNRRVPIVVLNLMS
jgi:hypothetical protein